MSKAISYLVRDVGSKDLLRAAQLAERNERKLSRWNDRSVVSTQVRERKA